MISRKQLEKLQHKCKGADKENLYHLIGKQGAQLDHEQLRKFLETKKRAWMGDVDKSLELNIVTDALNLFKTSVDKAAYDRFLGNSEPQTPPDAPEQGAYQAPPVQPPQYEQVPNQQPWGPTPVPPPWTPPKPPKRRLIAGLLVGTLTVVIAIVGLIMVWGMISGLLDWIDSPTTTLTTSEPTTEDGDTPNGASSRTEGETTPPSPPPDNTRLTSTERGQTPPTTQRDPPPPLPVAPAPPPAPDPPEARSSAPLGAGVPDQETQTVGTAQPEATTAPPAAAEATEPTAADPPAIVEPVRVGGNVPQPRKTWNVTAEYPRMAYLRRVQGIVILEVTVDREGEVSKVSVLRSSEGLDEAAVDAVRQWRYEPTMVQGRPVSVILTATVRFQITN